MLGLREMKRTALVCITVALLLAPSAQGATVGWTLPLTMPGGGEGLIDPTTTVWQGGVDPSTGASFKAPSNGTITAFHIQIGVEVLETTVKFKVIRPTGVVNQFTVVAESGPHSLTASTVNSFTGLSIPVLKDDEIAVTAFAGSNADFVGQAAGTGDLMYDADGDPAVGGTVTFTQMSFPNWRMPLSADFSAESVTPPDTTPPAPEVTRPKNGARLSSERARKLKLEGTTDSDTTKVEIALVKNVKKKGKRRCRAYNGSRKRFNKKPGPCSDKRLSFFDIFIDNLGSGKWSYKPRGGLGKGSYTLYVRGVDSAGNTTEASSYGKASFSVRS